MRLRCSRDQPRGSVVAEADAGSQSAIVPREPGHPLQRIIAEGLDLPIAISEGLEPTGCIITPLLGALNVVGIGWVSRLFLATHGVPLVFVSVTAVVNTRVLESVEQTNGLPLYHGIIGISADRIRLGSLRHPLL